MKRIMLIFLGCIPLTFMGSTALAVDTHNCACECEITSSNGTCSCSRDVNTDLLTGKCNAKVENGGLNYTYFMPSCRSGHVQGASWDGDNMSCGWRNGTSIADGVKCTNSAAGWGSHYANVVNITCSNLPASAQ